jgi:hypothetical protein
MEYWKVGLKGQARDPKVIIPIFHRSIIPFWGLKYFVKSGLVKI